MDVQNIFNIEQPKDLDSVDCNVRKVGFRDPHPLELYLLDELILILLNHLRKLSPHYHFQTRIPMGTESKRSILKKSQVFLELGSRLDFLQNWTTAKKLK